MPALEPTLASLSPDDVTSWVALGAGIVLGILSAIAKWQRDRVAARLAAAPRAHRHTDDLTPGLPTPEPALDPSQGPERHPEA